MRTVLKPLKVNFYLSFDTNLVILLSILKKTELGFTREYKNFVKDLENKIYLFHTFFVRFDFFPCMLKKMPSIAE